MRAQMFGVVVAGLILMGGNCSRARVESMNEMNVGVELAQMKRFTEAAESLEKAGAIDPTNHQAYFNLAIVRIELRSFSAAREALERAIIAKPDIAGYHEKLGTVLMELEDWKGAQAALTKSLELDPTLFKAHFKLGRCSEELEDPQSALYQYTDAIKTGPRFLPSYSALGRLYADLRYPDNAAQVLKEGLKVAMPGTEEEANIHHLLGTVYQQQRKYDEAIAEFQTALGIVPGMSDALFSLGWTYALQGNDEEAKRYLDKYVMMAGADAPEHYLKAARDRLAELRTESP
ncbi:MAG: tetratricopeptide repeat protein [Polyangiales bacterium]